MAEKKRKPKSLPGKGAGKSRVAERYRLELPTLLWELGETRERALPTQTGDISRRGLFLRGEVPLRPGSMISFEVQLPPVGDQPGGTMVGQATIVRQDNSKSGRMGIGAVIHQCEVWPAKPLAGSRATTHRGDLARSAGAANSEKRSSKERRAAERRKLAARARKAAALKAERRRENRRSDASRRKS